LFEDLQDKYGIILPLCLFLATILTRIPFTSKLMYHLDSIHFALALDHYDITVHQPHHPGYFLYVMLGRFFDFFIHDPHTSYISTNILSSALSVLVIYYLVFACICRNILTGSPHCCNLKR